MKRTVHTVQAGTLSLVLLTAVLGLAGCKGTVERNDEGEVTSVGVKTDPKATEAAKEAGHDVAEATKEAGQEMKQGVEKAGDAMAESAGKARESLAEGAAKAEAATDDAGITAKVKAKLLADPEVGGLKIGVETKDGKVTLTGSAESDYQRKEAAKLARHTEGVVTVDNQIAIKPKA